MEMGEKEKEMPSSFRYYTSSTDHHERGRKSATDHRTLNHHRPPPPHIYHETTDKSRSSSRDSDLNPVSATPVSPLPSSCARPFSLPSHLQQQQKMRYRECQRNHAASSGGHVVDGCGEFMPAGEEGTPEYLRCAACDCHRSFHRREIDGEVTLNLNAYGHYSVVATGKVSSQRNQVFPPPQQLPTPLPISLHQHVSPFMMNFGGGGPAESSTEDLNDFRNSLSANEIDQLQQPKKRIRTKFNQEQKEKMQVFADKIGWKITKQDEEEVQQFCFEINVKRKVFKVWMHNNKQATRKTQM